MGHDKTLDHFLHDYEAPFEKMLKWIFVVNDVKALQHFARLKLQNLFPSIILQRLQRDEYYTGKNSEGYVCRPQ